MTIRSVPSAVPASPVPKTDAGAGRTWECGHARLEHAQAIASVYVGFGTVIATAETGPGIAVGTAITALAIGDTIVKSDAADHACGTGRYAGPQR